MNAFRYTKENAEPKRVFLLTDVPRPLIVIAAIFALGYTAVLTFFFPISNPVLFGLLIASQLFFLWQGLTFLYTVWNVSHKARFDPRFSAPVDVFITVAGEPVDIVEETVRAAAAMEYPGTFTVNILNDGFVAKKENWKQIEELAARYGVNCITRKMPGGAKAGNINNAMAETRNPFVVIFDADHIPDRSFLQKTMGYFTDWQMGFVQSPQFYKNADTNYVTRGSWDQQALFFGPIKKGKNRLNSATMCGTNMVIRRTALEEAGGMCATNIAEDFVTGLFIHQNGWRSYYVPEVLAEGLAPEDFLTYYKQQLRWARGSLEVLFKYNPLLRRHRDLTWGQKIQYLASASYYLSGLFIAINILIPLVFFFTGAVPFLISTMTLAIIFIPYIFITIYTVQLSANFSYTFRALAFSFGSWTIHLRALFELLLGKKSGFSISSKRAVQGNFIRLAVPHITYLVLAFTGAVYSVMRDGWTASVATNIAWAVLNSLLLMPFINAALPELSHKQTQSQSQERIYEPGKVTQTN